MLYAIKIYFGIFAFVFLLYSLYWVRKNPLEGIKMSGDMRFFTLYVFLYVSAVFEFVINKLKMLFTKPKLLPNNTTPNVKGERVFEVIPSGIKETYRRKVDKVSSQNSFLKALLITIWENKTQTLVILVIFWFLLW